MYVRAEVRIGARGVTAGAACIPAAGDARKRFSAAALPSATLGFGRIVVSDTEAPNMLANLVCSGRASLAQSDNETEPCATSACSIRRSCDADCREKGVRLAQKMRVGPCIPVGMQR